jgi:hypothetical protein
MAVPVVTVASGGKPVVDVTADAGAIAKFGVAVSEAANGLGMPVTKVTPPKGGTPVIYVAPPP